MRCGSDPTSDLPNTRFVFLADMTKTTTCACGSPAKVGRTLCRSCTNARRRERYATDDEFRKDLINRAKENYDIEHKKKLYHHHRRKAFEVLGGYLCKKCGFDDPRALQIDHLGDDGYLKRKGGELGQTLYRRVLKMGGVGFQVLCANCNWIKKAESEGRTIEYYWEEASEGFRPRQPNQQCVVSPEDAFAAFATGESASSVRSRLHVSAVTLRNWWVGKFGEEAVRLRARTIQAKAVTQTGHQNRGRVVTPEVRARISATQTGKPKPRRS